MPMPISKVGIGLTVLASILAGAGATGLYYAKTCVSSARSNEEATDGDDPMSPSEEKYGKPGVLEDKKDSEAYYSPFLLMPSPILTQKRRKCHHDIPVLRPVVEMMERDLLPAKKSSLKPDKDSGVSSSEEEECVSPDSTTLDKESLMNQGWVWVEIELERIQTVSASAPQEVMTFRKPEEEDASAIESPPVPQTPEDTYIYTSTPIQKGKTRPTFEVQEEDWDNIRPGQMKGSKIPTLTKKVSGNLLGKGLGFVGPRHTGIGSS